MPVLNERVHHNFASAIDAEGFVHLDLELELELELGVELGSDGKTCGYPDDWTKSSHVTCKVYTLIPLTFFQLLGVFSMFALFQYFLLHLEFVFLSLIAITETVDSRLNI